MISFVSKFSFYSALLISSVLSVMLIVAAGRFGVGWVVATAPPSALFVIAMLFNPLIFGMVGVIKKTDKWRFIAAAAMMTLPLSYTISAWGLL